MVQKMELKEMKKNKNWGIRGAYEMAAECIDYKKMIDYCEVIHLMGVENIIVEYYDEDRVYIFKYDYDFNEVIYEKEEKY